MSPAHSLKATLLTAAAALLCSGLQFAGIDGLAVARSPGEAVQLPTVLVTAQRVEQLPRVVVVGQRSDRAATVAAQAKPAPAAT